MNPDELRNQARRWRERAPQHDEPTAEALVEAAGSFEALADETDQKAKKPATDKPDGKAAAAQQPAPEFMHRAYEPKSKPKSG
jgi:hypothetical protein